MRKRWLCLFMALVMVFSFTGCKEDEKTKNNSSKETAEDDVVYKYTEDVSEYITIPEDYKGIEVSGYVEVTDRDVEQQIGMQRHFNMKRDPIKEGTVTEGASVNVTSIGTLKGESQPFESQDYDIDLGKGQFLKEYEEALIGMKVGETKTITLTFPDDYGAVDYQGKEATFVVTLNYLYGDYYVPEWTDELAQELSDGVYKNTADFEAAIRKQLQAEKDEEIFYTQQTEIITYLVENSTVHKFPEGQVEEQYESLMEQAVKDNEENYGYTDFEEYIKEVHDCETEEEFEEYLMENAQNAVTELLIYQTIAMKENLSLSSLEYSNYLTAFASSQGSSAPETFEEEIKKAYGEDFLWKKFLNNKVLECLQAFAKVQGTETPVESE